MKFGGMAATNISDWQIFQELKAHGYGWAPDSQMIWPDCYATLALAAYPTFGPEQASRLPKRA